MLSKLFNRNKSQFHELFQYLDEIESGLCKRTARYILEGLEPAIVSQLGNLTDLQRANAGLQFLRYYVVGSSKEAERRAKSLSKFVKKLLGEEQFQDPDVARRLGYVVAALIKDRYLLSYNYKQVPEWVDGFVCFLSRFVSDSYNTKYQWPEHYTGDWFVDILIKNDVAPDVIFAPLLERNNDYGAVVEMNKHFMQTLSWQKWIDQPEFTQWLDKLHFSAKVSLAQSLNKLCHLNANFPLLTQLLTDKSKKVRETAETLLSQADITRFQAYALKGYDALDTSRRKELGVLLVLHGDDATSSKIKALLVNEKSKAVKETISAALLNRSASLETSETLCIPEVPALPEPAKIPESFAVALAAELEKEKERAKQGAQHEIAINKENGWKQTWRQEQYKEVKGLTLDDVKRTVRSIDGSQEKPVVAIVQLLLNSKLLSDDCLYLNHVFCMLTRLDSRYGLSLRHGFFAAWVRANPNKFTDLRQLVPFFREANFDLRDIAGWYLGQTWGDNSIPELDNLSIWPFFAEYPEYLEEAFGLQPSLGGTYDGFQGEKGVKVLAHFPMITEKFLQVLYKHALSPSKTFGPIARQTIEKQGVAHNRVIDALKSSKQEERIVAAQWIVALKLLEAVPALKVALKKETRETVKAALLSALHDLGESISDYLSPKTLLAEAEKGLKKAIPKAIDWFPFDTLPKLHWRNGKTVEPSIIKWWLVLAAKLKQPQGNPLLTLYLEQLQDVSQKALGHYVFEVFIGYDTQCPSDEQAREYALQYQQSRFDYYQQWAQSDWGDEYKGKTLQDAYNSLFSEKKAMYLGSGINAKGILCFGANIEAADGVVLLNRYMKDHYTRRHQIEAMLSAFAMNNHPSAIQLLLSVARRHRTNSVQEKARELVKEIAQRNGWTQDELADRTIPSAGFEQNGTQKLEFGSRTITIRLTDDMKAHIENEKGKIIKSLPAARQDDDADKVKEAKKQFSVIKKELKQVTELQSARMYEAMCVERIWNYSEWQEYLYSHPLMTHFVQRLVWVISQNDNEYIVRPTAEGELIDGDDEPVDALAEATIRIAHYSALGAGKSQLWKRLLKEEKIKPLFDQFTGPSHTLSDKERKATKLSYHEGWVTDTYTFRGVLTKLGYKRGDAEDAGYFSHYYKDFDSLGLRLIIEFSGNTLPEEQVPAVLFHVAFVTSDDRGWISEDAHKSISDVPINLVMEAMKDYESIAAKANYEEDWKAKCPW